MLTVTCITAVKCILPLLFESPSYLCGHYHELTHFSLVTWITQRRIRLVNFCVHVEQTWLCPNPFTTQRRRVCGKSYKIQCECIVRAFRFSWVKLGRILQSDGYNSRFELGGRMALNYVATRHHDSAVL